MLQTLKTPGDTSWFTQSRFGLFIHWGLYALGARNEWIKHDERISNAEYDDRYFRHFNPDLYDPDAWAQTAADAGMKYFVITTKHHEGFCLWDSAHTDYKATKAPVGRDLLRPMIEAFRKRGIRIGLYYSLLDWHHPQYIIDPYIGPLRDHPEREKLNEGRDQRKYAQYLHNQVRELLTQFGQIDLLWLDYSYPRPDGSGKGREDWQSEELLKLVRQLQPNIVLNDRLDLPDGWDIKTPEQTQPQEWVRINGTPVVWEACQTFSNAWGYHRDEHNWRSSEDLICTLIDCVSKGGNLLLNVGPTGRGEFEPRAIDRLQEIGHWMRQHSGSVYGCTQAPAEFVVPNDCRFTYNSEKNRLYVHLFSWPYKHLHLEHLADKVEYAQLLHDASELKLGLDTWHSRQIQTNSGTLTISLPVQRPNVSVPVIELFLKRNSSSA